MVDAVGDLDGEDAACGWNQGDLADGCGECGEELLGELYDRVSAGCDFIAARKSRVKRSSIHLWALSGL